MLISKWCLYFGTKWYTLLASTLYHTRERRHLITLTRRGARNTCIRTVFSFFLFNDGFRAAVFLFCFSSCLSGAGWLSPTWRRWGGSTASSWSSTASTSYPPARWEGLFFPLAFRRSRFHSPLNEERYVPKYFSLRLCTWKYRLWFSLGTVFVARESLAKISSRGRKRPWYFFQNVGVVYRHVPWKRRYTHYAIPSRPASWYVPSCYRPVPWSFFFPVEHGKTVPSNPASSTCNRAEPCHIPLPVVFHRNVNSLKCCSLQLKCYWLKCSSLKCYSLKC